MTPDCTIELQKIVYLETKQNKKEKESFIPKQNAVHSILR